MSALTTRDVRVKDVSFHLSTCGDPSSRPVLWLHGSGPGVSALTNWQGALEEFSGDFYNIAPDVVGFGDSTHPNPPPQGIAAFTALRVRTLVELLDHLRLDQVDIVGNSMGGIIGLCLALAHPLRVRRIVLMGAGGAPLPPTPALLSLILFYDNPSVEALRQLLTTFVADPTVFDGQLDQVAADRIPRATRPEVERSHRATFARAGDPLPTNDAALATITQPVLLIHGDTDRIIPLAASTWYAGHLPNARLEVIANAGHWLQIEHPDTFCQLVREFLT